MISKNIFSIYKAQVLITQEGKFRVIKLDSLQEFQERIYLRLARTVQSLYSRTPHSRTNNGLYW